MLMLECKGSTVLRHPCCTFTLLELLLARIYGQKIALLCVENSKQNLLLINTNISGKRPKSADGKSFSCRFSFSAERNAIEYVAFGFSFRVLVFFSF